MKYVLFYLIVTANGVTESHSDFDTELLCLQAENAIHERWEESAILIQTECKSVTFYDQQPTRY